MRYSRIALFKIVVGIAVVAAFTAFGIGPSAWVAPAKAAISQDGINADDPVLVGETSTSTTYQNPNGTLTTDIAAGPIRVPDPSGPSGWAAINTALEHADGAYEPAAVAADISFSDGGTGELASIGTLNGADSYGLDWPDALPSPTIDGNTATYKDVWPGIDLVLTAHPTGFSQRFVIRERPTEPLVLRFPLSLRGLHATLDDSGALTLTNDDGDQVAAADPAYMWGADMDPHANEPTKTSPVDVSIVDTKGGPMLEERPDPAFLADPSVSYPVVIDPSPDLSVSADTYVSDDFPNTSYGGGTLLKSGTYNGGTTKNRSYVKFSGFAALAGQRGAVVSQAILKLYETWSYSCTPSAVQVWAVDGAFNTSTTWNNQPGQTTMYASLSTANGYSSSCPDGTIWIASGGSNGNTLADIVQKWVDTSVTNYGFRVRAASETDSNGWKQFNSNNASAHQPIITVTYDHYPGTPSSLTPADGATVTDPSPTLSATYQDEDSGDAGSGRARFWVYDSHGDAVVDGADGLAANPGDTSSYTIPAGVLQSGQTYTWKARAWDGTLLSQTYTTTRAFTTDSDAPTAPTVTSGTHPIEAAWYPQSTNLSATFAASDPTPGSGLAGYSWSLTTSPDAVPDTTLDAPPSGIQMQTPGVWYLAVRAKDVAGNWSDTTRQAVQVGTPAAVDGSSTTLTWTASDGARAATFAGTAGMHITALVDGAPDGSSVSVVGPDGTEYALASVEDGDGTVPNLTLPDSGTYAVLLSDLQPVADDLDNPLSPQAGQATLHLYDSTPGQPASVVVNGDSASLSFATPFGEQTASFAGNAGRTYAITLTGLDAEPADVAVDDPNGQPVDATHDVTADSPVMETEEGPTSGTYTVDVTSQSAATAQIGVSVREISPTLTVDAATDGTPTALTLGDGQDATLALTPTTSRLFIWIDSNDLAGAQVTLTDTTTGESAYSGVLSGDPSPTGPIDVVAGDEYEFHIWSPPGTEGAFSASFSSVDLDPQLTADPENPASQTATLSGPGMTADVAFTTATANEQVRLAVAAVPGDDGWLTLINSAGTAIYTATVASGDDVDLPSALPADTYTASISPIDPRETGDVTVQLADTAPPTVTTTTAPSSPGGSVATTVPASAQSVVHLQTTAHPSRLSVGATVAANVTVVNSGTGALIASGTATVADPLDVPAAALPQNGAVTVQATNTTTSGGQMVIAGGDPYVALSQAVIDPNASTAISPTDSAGTPATSDANSAIVAQTPVGALDVSSEDNTTTVQTGDGDGFAVTPDVASNAPVPLVPGIVGMPADSATEPSSIVQASSDELKLGAVFSDATDLTASFLIGDAADPTTPTLDSPNDEIAVIGEDGTPLATLDDLTAVDAAGTAVSATATIDQNDHLAIQVTPTPSTVYPIVATITPHRLPGGGGGPSNGPGGAVSDDVARDGENLTKVKNCKTDLKTGASAQCENTLLAHYQPVLVMSPNELFYPSDVSGFTEHSAYHDRDGHVVWRNDGPSALPSGSTNRDDYLQLLGCPEKKAGPLTDCARMASAASDYSNPTTSTHRMYARFVPVSSTDKHQAIAYGQGVKYVLQYWMFYWADDYYDENLAQQHQGDWEFAQIDLNGSGAPKRIVVSQHACGEQLTWGQEKLWGWQHPVLFVSRGSHSLWFAGGRKTLGRGSRCGDFGLDQTYKVSVHGVGYTLHLASAADAANKFHGWHDTTPTAATGRYLFPQGDIRPTRPRHTSLVRISGAPNTDTSWVHYQGHWGDRQYVGLNHPTICNSLGINICISLPSLFIPTGRGPEGLESSKRWHTYGNPVFWYDSRTAGCRWPIRSVLSQTGTTC